jgi:hypothetical protein
VFSFFSPGALEGSRKVPLLDATPVAYAPKLDYVGDIGFDLGGPIIKNRPLVLHRLRHLHDPLLHRPHHPSHRQERPGRGRDRGGPHLLGDLRGRGAHHPGSGQADLRGQHRQPPHPRRLRQPHHSGGGASFDGVNVKPGDYGLDPQTGTPRSAAPTRPTGPMGHCAPVRLHPHRRFLALELAVPLQAPDARRDAGTHYQSDSVRASDGSSSLSNSRTRSGTTTT